MRLKSFSIFLIFSLFIGIFLQYSGDVNASKKRITLNKTSVSLNIGEKFKLKTKIKPASLRKKIKYSSSKKKVAKVNKKGRITAVAKGKAKISVKVKGKKIKAVCVVTVKKTAKNESWSTESSNDKSINLIPENRNAGENRNTEEQPQTVSNENKDLSKSVSWNFKDQSFKVLEDITSTITVDGITLTATKEKPMAVVTDKQEVDKTEYTHALSLGGGGNTSYRSVKIPVSGMDTIKVILRSTGESSRTLVVADESGNQVGVLTAYPDASLATINYMTGKAGYIYLYSTNSNINIYKIQVDQNNDVPATDPTIPETPVAKENPGSVPGDIYVSPYGKESGNGTAQDPMDIATALTKIQSGNTIWCQPGTYKSTAGFLISENNSGKEGAYKKISSINGENVIFDFTGMKEDPSNRGFVLDGSYWHFYDVDITGAGDNGMLLSGDNNIIELCQFYSNHDTGLQISRYNTKYSQISQWPTGNIIKNCTSYNNKDDKTAENADGFAAKLTCGNGNVFDGCIAYCNSDDGWDLYAKPETGSIGVVTIKNCVAFGNGKLTNGEGSANGDMNGFKLGGSNGKCPTNHIISNCLAFYNGATGFTDNGNGGAISMIDCTAVDNGKYDSTKANYMCYRTSSDAKYTNLLSYYTSGNIPQSDKFLGKLKNCIYAYKSKGYYHIESGSFDGSVTKQDSLFNISEAGFKSLTVPGYSAGKYETNYHTVFRNADGSLKMSHLFEFSDSGFGAKFK